MDSLDILDIEIINHTAKKPQERWNCDQCRLHYLAKDKLDEHKNKAHPSIEGLDIKCRYCKKELTTNDSKECITNKKCETCEYRCLKCSQRFLRFSSLVNHEKQNSCNKNKKRPSVSPAIPSKAPVNGVAPKKTIKTLLPKRRLSEQAAKEPLADDTSVSEESPRKKQKMQPNTTPDASVNNNTKTPKVTKKKPINSIVKEPSTKTANSKPATPEKNSTTPSKASLNSPKVNIPVNYKPFSCHICGENFAFDKILLEHLKSHGDAANCFKCKYCGDEFDTIYNMQFHLATCELADNEIETLQNSIPTVKITAKKSSDVTSEPRKRGRPRKNPVETPKDSSEKEEESAGQKGRSKRFSEGTPQKLEESEEQGEVTKSNKRRKTEKTPTKKSPPKRRSRATKDPSPPPPDPSPEPTAGVDCGEVPPLEDVDDNFHLEYTEDPLAEEVEEATPQTMIEEKKTHACPWPRCTVKFTREKALLCHLRTHQDESAPHLKCHKCDLPCEDLVSLRHHINECEEGKRPATREEKDDDDDFKGRRTKQKRQLSEKPSNRRSVEPVNAYRCDMCERVYPSEEKLAGHACHGANPLSSKFPCRLCQLEMKDPQSLSTHFASEHPENKIFECPTCGKEFDDLKEILDHGYAHLASNFECQVCIEKLPSRAALMQHCKEVHPGVDTTVCVVCHKRYSNTAALSKHRHVHTGERPFHCPYCYATFSLKCSQQVHVRRHINYRPFKCEYCPKRFFNSGDMTKHKRMHTQERPYKCEKCGMEFHNRESLVNHWKVHREEKGLKCPKCPKTFHLKTQLFNHMPVHIGVKPFKCPLCEEACYHLGGIQVHINTFHVKEGMTKCELCGQTQKLRYKLVQHLMTHRSDFFQSKSDWRNHLKKVKPVMKVEKGQDKIKTTEQDIYGIIRKKRSANKINGPVIPITPEEEGLYQEASDFEGEERYNAFVEVKPVKKQRRRRKKNEMIEHETNFQGLPVVINHNQFMTDPLAIYEDDFESKPNIQQKKKRPRKNPVKNTNLMQIESDPLESNHYHFMTDPLAIDEEDAESQRNVPQKKKRQRKNTSQVQTQKQKAVSSRKPAPKSKQARSRQRKQVIEEEYPEEKSEEDDQNGIQEELVSEYSDEEWIQEERCYEPLAQDRDRTCGVCNVKFDTADLLRSHVIVHI